VLSVRLPWYALPVLAAIPLAAKIPVSDKSAVWLQAILLSAVTVAFAVGAIYLSWRINGWSAL
jgi:hypothetical protein